MDFNIRFKEAQATIAVNFAETQAELYKDRLEELEQALYEFKIDHPFESSGKDLDMNTSMLISYQTSLTNIELNLKQAEFERDELYKKLTGEESIVISVDDIRMNPADGEYLSGQITKLTENLVEDVTIKLIKDAGLVPGSCVLETDQGNLDASINVQLDELKKILEID